MEIIKLDKPWIGSKTNLIVCNDMNGSLKIVSLSKFK